MIRFRRGLAAGSAVALAMTAQTGIATSAPAIPIACGTLITSSVTLTGNVGPCAGDGITIVRDGVTLNLNGYRVFGTTTATGIAGGQFKGILFQNVSDSQVRNGEVTGFATGVRIDGGARNRVQRINSHDNIGPSNSGDNGDGISVWNSNNNTIEGNMVARNGPYSGIALITGFEPYGADAPVTIITGNKILNNQVLDNNVAPCTAPLGCLPRNKQTGALAPESGRVPMGGQTTGSNNDGVRIEGPNATNSRVEGNTVNDSGNNGIFVQPSCRNAFDVPADDPRRCAGDIGNIGTLIRNNVANHNGYGRATGSGINMLAMLPNLKQAAQTMVVGNTARFNYQHGIEIDSACSLATDISFNCAPNSNTLLRNNASNNLQNGIRVGALSSENTISQNRVNVNGRIGLELQARAVSPATTPVTYVPGTGAFDNTLVANQGKRNGILDGADRTPDGGTNDWVDNQFITVNQLCVLDTGSPALAAAAAADGNGEGDGVGLDQLGRSAP